MSNMQGEALEKALKDDQAQKSSVTDMAVEVAKRARAVKLKELGLPDNATDEVMLARAQQMAEAARKAAAGQNSAPDLDETQAALEGKPGAQMITIAPAELAAQIEQKTAVLSKVVASSLVEVSRSMLPELFTCKDIEQSVVVVDGVKQKQTRQVSNTKRMDDLIGTMTLMADLASRFDMLGDKATARLPEGVVMTGKVQATSVAAQPEVVQGVPEAVPEGPPAAS
jgi:hypothetical protein